MRDFGSDFTTPIASGPVPTAELLSLPATASAGGSNAVFTHPFQVVASATTSGKVQVVDDSLLLDFVATNESSYAISNLATDLTIAAGDAIYLHGTVSAGVVTAVEIVVDADDDLALEFDGTPEQTDFWLRIAVAEAGPVASPATGIAASSSVWVRQRVFTHLRLTNYCTDGGPALYPVAA